MSQSLQTQTQTTGSLSEWVTAPNVQHQVASAVAAVMDGNQFIAQMLATLAQPDYAQCTKASKQAVFFQCAAMGLLPSAGQVALIVRKGELTAMPQWQGYKAMMERHPAILEVQAYIVHAKDAFSIANGVPQHSYDPLDGDREIKTLADVRGGYCKILYRDGRPPRYHFVTGAHIAKARGCAQTKNVWDKWPEQMILKTLFRDCYARRAVPIDPLVCERLERLGRADDVLLGNDPRGTDDSVKGEKPKTLKERLKTRTDARETKASDAERTPEPTADGPSPADMAMDEYQAVIPQAATAADAESYYTHAADNPALAGHPELLAIVRAMVDGRKAELAK